MYVAKNQKKGFGAGLLIAVLILIAVLVAGGLWIFNKKDESSQSSKNLLYHSFVGGYVFEMPDSYTLDDQSLPGIQLLYTGQLTAIATLDEAYEADAIAVQPIGNLVDKKGEQFEKHINENFLPELKKLSPDTVAEFEEQDGKDVAKITVKADGKPLRFIFIKNGKHPYEIVAKEQTEVFNAVQASVKDIESSALKNEAEAIKKAATDTAKLINEQNSQKLFSQASDEFKEKTGQDVLDAALKQAAPYIDGALTISGVAYKSSPATATLVFSTNSPDEEADSSKPSVGVIYLSKVDGDWKLKGLNLPSPASSESPDR